MRAACRPRIGVRGGSTVGSTGSQSLIELHRRNLERGAPTALTASKGANGPPPVRVRRGETA